MNTLTLGSLFDGSGTAPLAATMCGITPVWASEIEPYPIRVTTARFPDMKHLGNITDINGAEVTPVDIICGGSPCQDLSVAGKQVGLHDGERSHLFFEMTRIIKEMRGATNGRYPRYIVWENVPGAFSSNKGRDFLAVLQAFAEIADPDIHVPEPKQKACRLVWKLSGYVAGDGWSLAWRTVDAQYWGVPQRRRRIYLVVDLGGECADEILFERTGVSGNSEPCGAAREKTAGDAGRSVDGSDHACIGFHLQQDPISSEIIAPCISGQNQASAGVACFMGGQGAKARSVAYCDDGTTPTLKSALSGGNTVPDVVYCIEGDGETRAQILQDISPCLKTVHPNVNCYLNSNRYIIRRLTPLECCRLQGFPDWWEDGVEGSDSARYKMWGNGMALPNMLHVMKGIVRVQEDRTLWVR